MNKPIIRKLFPTAIGEFHCDEHSFNKSVFYDVFPDHSYLLDDGSVWTGESSGFVYLHNDKRLAPLFTYVSKCIREYMQELRMRDELFSVAVVKSWVTLVDSVMYVPLHAHATSHFSFVYYIEVPHDADAISFCVEASPNQPFFDAFSSKWCSNVTNNLVTEYIDINSNEWTFPAEEGKLLIFPSHLHHKTVKIAESRTNTKRISLAGDVLLIYKEERPNYHTGIWNPNTWNYFD